MSKPRRYLPPEILDEIISFLRGEPEALMQCCLASKSWIPRTRKHLFAQIAIKNPLEWMEIFPDPTSSPAHYARKLTVDCALEDSPWIRGFPRVEQLILNLPNPGTGIISFTPLHNLAASLRSLRLVSDVLPRPQTFDLIRFLPLLEDLTLEGEDQESRMPLGDVSSPTSPPLTGTLELLMYEGMEMTLSEMLNLPGGLHFRELQLSWCGELEFPWVAKLVTACSDTLERLDIECDIDSEEVPKSIDLSKATKLKDIVFRCETACCGWIVTTLKTITTPKHQNLRIFLHAPFVPGYQNTNPEVIEVGDPGMRWPDLDRFLVQLWESRSVFLNVVSPRSGEKAKGWVEYLLPEVARRGTAELEEPHYIGDYSKNGGWENRSGRNRSGRGDAYVPVIKLGSTWSGCTSFV